jgi:hypothetical protein
MKDYMNYVSVEDALKAGRTDTICWDCNHAFDLRGGCSWADPKQQKPVDGWAATETDNGYCVHACPNFSRCSYGAGRYRTADDYILALEIANNDKSEQIVKLKKTLWWKVVNKLRCTVRKKNNEISALSYQVREMECDLNKELWWANVHCGE